MTKKLLVLAVAAILAAVVNAKGARADDIEYSCDGSYDSKTAFDPSNVTSVSVQVHLEATMLGDEDSNGNYTLTKANLKITATNDNGADAGSIKIKKPIQGKVDKALNPKFKGHIKFDLGSKVSPAYPADGDEPETYLLIPTDDNDDSVYIQRQGSGHDSYPTLTLKCAP